MSKTSIVIPNWNGDSVISECLVAALRQNSRVIVVDNGSTDNSVRVINEKFPSVKVIELPKNRGFAGGVNAGIKDAIEAGAKYVALLNNDAVASNDWLKSLVGYLDKNTKTGIATSKIIDDKGARIDSTGDIYTVWGLPYPRGRSEVATEKYDKDTLVFGASGGASLYRTKMLKEIGLFDEDFFAYYEDVDISWRAQLAGWKVAYVPNAVVYHQIGATSEKIKDFTTYQTLKNLPMLMWKNVPAKMLPTIWPRFELAYTGILWRAFQRHQFKAAFKGLGMWVFYSPKVFYRRYKIQKRRKASIEYLDSILVHDLPPNAKSLRNLRARWWKLRGKSG